MSFYNITKNEEEKYSSPIYKDRRCFHSAIDEFEWQKTQEQECSKCNKIKSLIYFENNTCGNLPFNPLGTRYKRKDCIECRKSTLKGQQLARKNTKKIGLSIIPPSNMSCEICKKSGNNFGKKSDKLVFDHCHKKEIFRGWLCDSCNRSLGIFGDNIEGLLKVINYLYKHEPFKLTLNEKNKYIIE